MPERRARRAASARGGARGIRPALGRQLERRLAHRLRPETWFESVGYRPYVRAEHLSELPQSTDEARKLFPALGRTVGAFCLWSVRACQRGCLRHEFADAAANECDRGEQRIRDCRTVDLPDKSVMGNP